MSEDTRVLQFQYLGKDVDVTIDIEKSNLLDVVIEYLEKGKELGFQIPRHPVYTYIWNMKHWPLENDKHLMSMFERFPNEKMIYIWVGSLTKPNSLNKLVCELMKTQATKTQLEAEMGPSVVVSTIVNNGAPILSQHVTKSLPVTATEFELYSSGGVDRPDKLPIRRKGIEVVEECQISNDKVEEDRVEAHFKKFEEIETYNPAIEEHWADIASEYDDIPHDPKGLKKFLNNFE